MKSKNLNQFIMYPTIEQVESADRQQLAYWYRFLPSPASNAIGKSNFNEVLNKEAEIMNLICKRFKEMGMFTPELSKEIGW